jgi:hypothetical protein
MPLNIVVTNAGRAAIVNAENTGTAPVTISEVGLSATAITPVATATALAGEFKRIAGVSGAAVADDTIHIGVTDESADVWTARSFALYLADGTLFGIYGQPTPIIEKSASSTALLAIDAIFADISAASLSFGNTNFFYPPATVDTAGVAELATLAEALAGTDAARILTTAIAKAAVLSWLLTQDGSGSGLDADLLDGQNGSYYADIAARLGFTPVNKGGDTMTGLLTLSGAPTANLHAATKKYVDDAAFAATIGYTPVNRAGDTMTGLLTLSGAPTATLHAATKAYVDGLVTAAALLAKIITVDGSGSGLDADLLDGQQGTFYTDIAARLGYTPVNKAGDTMTGLLTLSGAPTANLHAATKAYVDGLVTAAALIAKIITVDGSGSGLDADLLDGLDSTAFLKRADAMWNGVQSSSPAAWRFFRLLLTDGSQMRIQQGYQSSPSNGVHNVSFPTPYSTTGQLASVAVSAADIQVTPTIDNSSGTDNFEVKLIKSSVTNNGFSVLVSGLGSGTAGAGFTWRCIATHY